MDRDETCLWCWLLLQQRYLVTSYLDEVLGPRAEEMGWVN